jgi:unsaturated rhamnogalacturonyl hydrolase
VLFPSINFRQARIITTGPVRSEFELTYDAWDAGGRRVSETRRISIDAGSNMSRAESTFTSDDPSPIPVAIGIAQRPGDGAVATKDQDAGWMAYWQAPDRDRGSIGCAVVLQKGTIEEFVMETASVPELPPGKGLVPGIEGLHPVGNLLAITQAEVNKPLVYYLGAGWSRSGDFPDGAAWARYVGRFSERMEAPVRVSVSAVPTAN